MLQLCRRLSSGLPGTHHSLSIPGIETDDSPRGRYTRASSLEPELFSHTLSSNGDLHVKKHFNRNLLHPSTYSDTHSPSGRNHSLPGGPPGRRNHSPPGTLPMGKDLSPPGSSLVDHSPPGRDHSPPGGPPGGREGYFLSSARESELMTFSCPRHFQRRGGVVGDIDVTGIQRLSEDGDDVKVMVEEEKGGRQVTEIVTADNKPLRELLDYIFIKHDLEVEWDPPTHCFTVVMRNGTRTTPDLDLPVQQYAGGVVEIKPLPETSRIAEKKPSTLQSCLSYFSEHGLVELPHSTSSCEEEEDYHLPHVQALENIPGTWEDLPIKPDYKKELSAKQASQQQAIWELIHTEYSHIKQLEIIINLFMRSLELIHRANVMSHDNYHNVFGGYMEELYSAHEQFWSWTLLPCLEQVYLTGKPLDVSIIIQRFPEFSTHFEIYEQHCALDAVNIRNLNKAMDDQDFRTYLEWCEAHPECQRRKLKDFLVIPMQRLTKYPLLFTAVLRETEDLALHQQLETIWSEVDSFVQSVNTVLLAQSETERVRDAMSRITAYTAADIPGEYRELMQPYTHLDLMGPMPEVEIDKPRVLMLEGSLKYRDHSAKMVAHVFLFTDMLLITKTKRGGEKFSIERPPYQISSLVLHSLEPGSFLVLVLTRYHVLTTWFTLKAMTEAIATEWMQAISQAQSCYAEAVEKKAYHSKILQCLKTERILNGLEHRRLGPSKSVGCVLSSPRPSLSTDSLDHAHTRPHPRHTLFSELRPLAIHRSRSAELQCNRFNSNPSLFQNRSSDPATGRSDSVPVSGLERTSSLKNLLESKSPSSPTRQSSKLTLTRCRSQSMADSHSRSKISLIDLLDNSAPSPASDSDMNVHEDADQQCGVVMVTPPTPSSSTSHTVTHSLTYERSSPTHEKPNSDEEASHTHKKPHSNKETSHTHEKPHSNKETSHTREKPHSNKEMSHTHEKPHGNKETSHTHNKPHSNKETGLSHKKPHSNKEASHTHKKPHNQPNSKSGFGVLQMLGEATMSILASLNMEEEKMEPPHVVIPTSETSGSDSESVSSSPRTQVVECISDVIESEASQNSEHVTSAMSRDSKSDITPWLVYSSDGDSSSTDKPGMTRPIVRAIHNESERNKAKLATPVTVAHNERESTQKTPPVSPVSRPTRATAEDGNGTGQEKALPTPLVSSEAHHSATPPHRDLSKETQPAIDGPAAMSTVCHVTNSKPSPSLYVTPKSSSSHNTSQQTVSKPVSLAQQQHRQEKTLPTPLFAHHSATPPHCDLSKETDGSAAMTSVPRVTDSKPSPPLSTPHESSSSHNTSPEKPHKVSKPVSLPQQQHRHSNPRPNQMQTRRGVKELSKLFEAENSDLSSVKKSTSFLVGSSDDSCRGNNNKGWSLEVSNGIRKAVSSPKLDSATPELEPTRYSRVKGHNRRSNGDKRASVDDVLLYHHLPRPPLANAIKNSVESIQAKTGNYLLPQLRVEDKKATEIMMEAQRPQQSSHGTVTGIQRPQRSSHGTVTGTQRPQQSSHGTVTGTQRPQWSNVGAKKGAQRGNTGRSSKAVDGETLNNGQPRWDQDPVNKTPHSGPIQTKIDNDVPNTDRTLHSQLVNELAAKLGNKTIHGRPNKTKGDRKVPKSNHSEKPKERTHHNSPTVHTAPSSKSNHSPVNNTQGQRLLTSTERLILKIQQRSPTHQSHSHQLSSSANVVTDSQTRREYARMVVVGRGEGEESGKKGVTGGNIGRYGRDQSTEGRQKVSPRNKQTVAGDNNASKSHDRSRDMTSSSLHTVAAVGKHSMSCDSTSINSHTSNCIHPICKSPDTSRDLNVPTLPLTTAHDTHRRHSGPGNTLHVGQSPPSPLPFSSPHHHHQMSPPDRGNAGLSWQQRSPIVTRRMLNGGGEFPIVTSNIMRSLC